MSYQHILVATDFEPSGDAALTLAVRLAFTFGAKLTVLHVLWEPPVIPVEAMAYYPVRSAAELEADVAKVEAALKARIPADALEKLKPALISRTGSARQVILQVAEQTHADLIVLGSHGRHGVPRLLLGSVAETVVRHSPVSVLVARAPEAKPT